MLQLCLESPPCGPSAARVLCSPSCPFLHSDPRGVPIKLDGPSTHETQRSQTEREPRWIDGICHLVLTKSLLNRLAFHDKLLHRRHVLVLPCLASGGKLFQDAEKMFVLVTSFLQQKQSRTIKKGQQRNFGLATEGSSDVRLHTSSV